MGRNICICFPVIGRIDVCCHIAVVSEGNKNTQHIHWVQCPAAGNAGVYRLPRLWEQVADPFPWSLSCLALRVQPSGGEMESVCPQLAQHVFPNVSVPLFSSPVQSCSRWGDKHGAQPQAVQEIFQYFFQSKKHVLTACATSGGIFILQAILFCGHMTQYSWQVLFAHSAKAKHIFDKWNWKKKRSYLAIVSGILLREGIWHSQKSRLELSLVVQFKNKRLYGHYKCATTDTLKTVLASTLRNGNYSFPL